MDELIPDSQRGALAGAGFGDIHQTGNPYLRVVPSETVAKTIPGKTLKKLVTDPTRPWTKTVHVCWFSMKDEDDRKTWGELQARLANTEDNTVSIVHLQRGYDIQTSTAYVWLEWAEFVISDKWVPHPDSDPDPPPPDMLATPTSNPDTPHEPPPPPGPDWGTVPAFDQDSP